MLPLAPSYAANLAAYGFAVPVERFETLNTEEYTCPTCGSSDRDRLMGLYFLRHWVEEGRAGDARVLEIAPAAPLSALLRDCAADYRSGDLMSPAAMDRVDITDMACYEDGRFDLVVCSHVLEHVIDDGAALRELRRVLAPGGAAMLLVPLPLDVRQTDEVKAGEPMPDAAERIRRFAQDDHVRQYDREEFMARIGRAGLRLQVVAQADFPDDPFPQYGLLPRSRLYVAHRD